MGWGAYERGGRHFGPGCESCWLGYIVGREGEGGLVGWWVEWVAASPPLGRVCGTAGRMYGSIPRLPLFLNYQFFFREG